MRKNKLKQWLTFLLLCANACVVWGQNSSMPQNGKVYRVNTMGRNVGTTGLNTNSTTPYYLTSDVVYRENRQRLAMTSVLNANDPKFYFRLDANGNSTTVFAMYSLKRRQYFRPEYWNDNVLPFQSSATSQYMQFANGAVANTVKFNLVNNTSYFHAFYRSGSDETQAYLDRQGSLTDRHNFTFTQVNASVITVVSNVGNLGETYTFDGNNGVDNQFVAFWDSGNGADGVTIARTSTPAGYTFTGFTWAGQATPVENPTIDVTTLQNNPDLVVTANYTPSFYSTESDTKWVRVLMVRDGSEKYAWRLNDGTNTEGLTITTTPVDYADDRFLWKFVGDETNGFKLINKATGDNVALTTAQASPANNNVPSMTTATNARLWKLRLASSSGKSGYKLNVTTGNENVSPNALGGAGRGVAFYSIDDGSIWRIEVADAVVTLNTDVTGATLATIPATQRLMARLQISGTTAGNAVTSDALLTAGETKTLYLPSTGGFALATPVAMRNYGTIAATYTAPLTVSNGITHTITGDYINNENAHYLFTNASGSVGHYKVPAVTVTPSGDVIAMANYSVLGESSSGAYQTSAAILGGAGDNRMIPGKVRVALRVGSNNGATWSNEQFITPESDVYGDVAITADHKEDKVLVMMAKVTNNRAFNTSTRQAPLQIARIIGTRDNGGNWTWTQPEEVTTQIYDLNSTLIAAYFTSGRILQSKVVKNGTHFRVYASLVTRESGSNNWRNRVVYSDNFGQNWSLLGGATAVAIDAADEASLLEMPNGNLVISSRKSGGRKFSVFTYTDKAAGTGSWVASADGLASSAACNGDMLLVNVKNGSNKVALALHSLPTTSTYNNVGIYHKEANVNSTAVADWTSWSGTYSVSNTTSGYSAMDVQRDGNIGFFFEENVAGAGYNMVYKAVPVSAFNSSYTTADADVVAEATAVANNPGFVGSYADADVTDLAQANDAYNAGTALLRRVEAEMNLLKTTKQAITFDANKYYRLYTTDGNVVATNYAGGTTTETEDATKVSQFWKMSAVTATTDIAGANEPSSVTNSAVSSTDGVNFTMNVRNRGEASYRLKPVTSVAVNVRSTHSTFYFPFAVTKPEGVTLYNGVTASAENGKLVLQRIDSQSVAALTPVVLQADASGNKEFAIDYTAAPSSSTGTNLLRGVLAPEGLASGNYILRTVGVPTPGFYIVNKDNTTLPANKVYVVANAFGTSGTSFLSLVDGEEPTTGISGVATDSKAVKYYNLNGTPVAKPVSGVMYITSDGKKVIFK